MNLLILDSGHNEYVAGKEAPDKSLREWIFNNEIQYKIKELAEKNGMSVYLTNPNPAKKNEIGLTKRCELANNYYNSKNKPKSLFVSLHANAFQSVFNSARGTETFIASNASTNSRNGAKLVQDEIVKAMKLIDTGAKDRGVKVADFTVIKNVSMPSILCEYAFYSNKEDLAILKNNKDELAEATTKGICKYFGIEYKPPVKNTKDVIAEGDKFFKVCIGAYKSRNNSLEQLEKAKEKGFTDSYLIYE